MSSAPLLPDGDARTVARWQLSVSVFALLLVGATWPLWWPSGEYPVIPWFLVLLPVPTSVDLALAWGIVLSGIGVVVCSARRLVVRPVSDVPHTDGLLVARTTWLVCLAGSLLLDQQRMQVWAWQFLWLTLFLTLASPRTAQRCCRVFVLGIYVYSAISKLDLGFIEAQGPWLWQGLRRAIGLATPAWGPTPLPGAWGFPLGELLVAGLLGVRRTRWCGIAAACAMHLTLLLALGPLGWDQQPGVLLWNVFFLVSVPQLFQESGWHALRLWGGEDCTLQGNTRDRLCIAVVIVLSLWPALERFGGCDHWPAWAVYSSRPEVLSIQVEDESVSFLPASLQPHVGPLLPLSDRRPISVEQWSFEQRHCPVYPQARYRLAVARHIEATTGVQMYVIEQSGPKERRESGLIDLPTNLVTSLDDRFWFNVRSRVNVPPPPSKPGDRWIALAAQLSVACYALALLLMRRCSRPTLVIAGLWTAGLVSLGVHVACAFHFLHHWSHSAALQHTAERTFEVTGWKWSGGLSINYVFLLFWASDAVRLWREALGRTAVASPAWRRFVHGVFLFMMFNATVVFGPWHWTIAAGVFALAWWGWHIAEPAVASSGEDVFHAK